MPRRSIWSARQRAALFDLPTDEAALLRHYTLSDDDIERIRVRRGGHNRLGFALQLCAFRYPGRLLAVGEGIPSNVLRFIAAIVIYWNTAHLGEAVGHRKHAGLTVEPKLLAHVSPLGWAHILLTGEYRWPKRR